MHPAHACLATHARVGFASQRISQGTAMAELCPPLAPCSAYHVLGRRDAHILCVCPLSAVSWFVSLPTRAMCTTAGGKLPSSFWKPNKHNVRGGVEKAFLSTTYEKSVAFGYASQPGQPGLVFELQMGTSHHFVPALVHSVCCVLVEHN